MKKVITIVMMLALVLSMIAPTFASSYNPIGSTPDEKDPKTGEDSFFYTVKKTSKDNLKKDGVIGEDEYEKLDVSVDPDQTVLHLVYNQSEDYDYAEELLGTMEYYASWSDGQINIAVKASPRHLTQEMTTNQEDPTNPQDNFCRNLAFTISSDVKQARDKGKVCNFYFAIAKRTDNGEYLVGYYTTGDNQQGNSGSYVPVAEQDFAVNYPGDGSVIYEWSVPFSEICNGGAASAGDSVYLTLALTSGAGTWTNEWGDVFESWYGVAMGDFGFGVNQKDAKNHAAFRLSDETIGDDTPWENPFTDVKEKAFYYDAVEWAVKNGVTKGMTDTTFEPGTACNRGQVVTFLWRAAGSPAPSSDKCDFTDVKKGAFYYDAMLWAVENGITKGMTATTFAPNAVCNRGQVVTFLHRALGSPAPTATSTSFTDVKSGAFYCDAMLWAVEKGVTKGMTDTTFAPSADCNRGQVVTFLHRAFSLD